jgi:hypothetical protein
MSLLGGEVRGVGQPPRGPAGGRGQPRLVLHTTCTLNGGYIAPTNPEVRYTPALDASAAESTIFSRHMAEYSQSTE